MRFGVRSVRAFWQRVTEGDGPKVSYEAARYYHFDREAPASYLARVAKVFGVRLDWLVTGEGEMTEAAEAAKRGLVADDRESYFDGVVQSAFPGWEDVPGVVQHVFIDVVARAAEAQSISIETETGMKRKLPRSYIELAVKEVADVLLLPERITPVFGPMDRSSRHFTDYAVAMLHAISLGIGTTTSADPLQWLEPPTDPTTEE